MPLYEYECPECKHAFERIQLFSDPRIVPCPACGTPVEKLQSAPSSFQFTGTGFYATDYAAKGK